MIHIRLSEPTDHPALVDIWRRSVRATHDFLSDEDFHAIEVLVSERYVPDTVFWVAADGQRPVGFVGLSGAHIDALFIAPEARGRGVGRRLVAHAEALSGPLTVDVNEQNRQAVGFYERMGFRAVGRSAVDGAGRPYPLLHLSQRKAAVQPLVQI